MKKLYFVRHGESEFNVLGRFAGQVETSLTEKGKKQAKEAGKKLKNDEVIIHMIFSSPLSRAHDTAKHIATEIDYAHDDIQVHDALTERAFGILEGKPHEEHFKEGVEPITLDAVEGSETIEHLQMRANKVLEYLKSLDEDNILVVSHGQFGRALRRAAAGLPHSHEYSGKETRIGNAEIIEII